MISAVNIVEGGAFTILTDCLAELSVSDFIKDYNFVVLVNNISKMPKYEGLVDYIEFPKAKEHYWCRLYCEYYYFNKLSKNLDPELWLSLHDMSPRVKCRKQAVYMHNPSPFYKPGWKDWKFVPIYAIWAYLYKYVYRINIHSNSYLIVQQDWLREEFSKMFSFSKDRIIVARPVINISEQTTTCKKKDSPFFKFVYPAYPRVFKNFEVICEAARILENKGEKDLRIILTIDGSENKYSNYLVKKYRYLKLVEFRGLVEKNRMKELYDSSDCLIFPSKLETWGLPLSEFKPYDRPILAADLPYAHESVAGAKKVFFFPPDNAQFLADAITKIAGGDNEGFVEANELIVEKPHTSSWEELFKVLLS